jgi:hypothetical protein
VLILALQVVEGRLAVALLARRRAVYAVFAVAAARAPARHRRAPARGPAPRRRARSRAGGRTTTVRMVER